MALITKIEDYLECRFDTPITAATFGQSAVFYEGSHLVGGGIIV